MYDGFGVTPDWDEPRPGDILIRQSDINSMELCPARLGQSKLKGFNEFKSEALVFGSTVHNVIEHFLVGIDLDVMDGTEIPLDMLSATTLRSALAVVEEKDDFEIDDVATAEQQATFFDEVRAAFQLWHTQVWLEFFEPELPMVVERRLIAPLGVLSEADLYGVNCLANTDDPGCDKCSCTTCLDEGVHLSDPAFGRAVWLHGTPDLIVPGQAIHDWKTAGRGWTENPAGLTKGSFGVQAPLYLWLWEEETGEQLAEFTFWVYDRTKKVWNGYGTDWYARSILAAKRNAWMWAKQVDAQAFPFTPALYPYGKPQRGWHCSAQYCAAWDICDGKAMISDGADLMAKSPTHW